MSDSLWSMNCSTPGFPVLHWSPSPPLRYIYILDIWSMSFLMYRFPYKDSGLPSDPPVLHLQIFHFFDPPTSTVSSDFSSYPFSISLRTTLHLSHIILLYVQWLLLDRILLINILKCATSFSHLLKKESPSSHYVTLWQPPHSFFSFTARLLARVVYTCLCFHTSHSLLHPLHSGFINLTRMALRRFPTTSLLTRGHFLDPLFHSLLPKLFPQPLRPVLPGFPPTLSQSPLLTSLPLLLSDTNFLKVWMQTIHNTIL